MLYAAGGGRPGDAAAVLRVGNPGEEEQDAADKGDCKVARHDVSLLWTLLPGRKRKTSKLRLNVNIIPMEKELSRSTRGVETQNPYFEVHGIERRKLSFASLNLSFYSSL